MPHGIYSLTKKEFTREELVEKLGLPTDTNHLGIAFNYKTEKYEITYTVK